MNDDEMVQRITALYEFGDMSEWAKMQQEMAADDVVVEYPQSGERFRGRDNIARMNEGYTAGSGTAPKATLRRVVKPGAWVIESTIDYGDGVPVSAISILELGADGKVARQTDYFGNPFPAPDWRKPFTEG